MWAYLFSFFVLKQKTAYEVRIRDWSSDVCSSDLFDLAQRIHIFAGVERVFDQFATNAHQLSQQGQIVNLRREIPRANQRGATARKLRQIGRTPKFLRSEEHTSELQSLMRISYAVFCLTKKIQTNTHKNTIHFINTP